MAASDPFLKKLNESEHQQHHETGAKYNKNTMLIFWLHGQHPFLGKDNRMKAMRSQQQQTAKTKKNNI